MAWGSNLEIISSVLGITFFVYYTGFFLYMIYMIVDNTIYKNKDYQFKLAVII